MVKKKVKPKAQDDILKCFVLFCPQPKDINFTVIEEERNKNIFMFNKLEAVL